MKKILSIFLFSFLISGSSSAVSQIGPLTELELAPIIETPVIKWSNLRAANNVGAKLISSGTEPKRELRFKPTAPSKKKVTIGTDASTVLSMNGIARPQNDIPSMQLDMEVEIIKVEMNGDIHANFNFTNIKVGDKEYDPRTSDEIAKLKGSFIVDNLGNIKDVNSIFSHNNSTIQGSLTQVSNILEQMILPLPSQPIGIGAKWQTNKLTSLNGLNVEQTIDYELKDIQNDTITLVATSNHSAGSQKLERPRGLEAMSVEVISLDSKGDATIKMKLDTIVPVTYMMNFNSNTKMKIVKEKSAEGTLIESTAEVKININSR